MFLEKCINILPIMELMNRSIIVTIVEDITLQLVLTNALFFMNFHHALVKSKMRDRRYVFSCTELLHLLRLISNY